MTVTIVSDTINTVKTVLLYPHEFSNHIKTTSSGSCIFGSPVQGRCWDRTAGTPSSGPCSDRYCRAGWTCSCLGRSHLCPLKNITTTVISHLSGGTAYCRDVTVQGAGNPEIRLGSLRIGISRRALERGECKELSWWQNGVLMGEYGVTPRINRFNLESELERRGTHTNVELRRGDLLAFRFADASYHCFTHMLNVQVDGDYRSLGHSSMSVRFARQYSRDWYDPLYTPTLSEDEDAAAPSDFLPLRTNFFSNGGLILSGWDYWREPDGTRDHMKGNFYYRVQL
ncbi:hypothetical protein FGB62_59g025 [Gracilaria domingensis]|nr:hypothetical protein FGB62_59g025 [Gracilaria domingensis]